MDDILPNKYSSSKSTEGIMGHPYTNDEPQSSFIIMAILMRYDGLSKVGSTIDIARLRTCGMVENLHISLCCINSAFHAHAPNRSAESTVNAYT